jgi:hypothetical protein
MAQQTALAETTMAVFAESRVVRDAVGKIKTTEPSIRQVQMHLFTKAPFGPDAKTVFHQKHSDHQFRINRWATRVALEICQMSPDGGS